MEKPKNIDELVFAWPKPGSVNLASDISTEASPVTRQKVTRWITVDAIPAKYFGRILRAAKVRGIILSSDDLTKIHDEE